MSAVYTDTPFEPWSGTATRLDEGVYFLERCSCVVFTREDPPDRRITGIEMLTRQEWSALMLFVKMQGVALSAFEIGLRLRKEGVSAKPNGKVAHSGQVIISGLRAKLHDWQHTRLRTVWGTGSYVLIVQ